MLEAAVSTIESSIEASTTIVESSADLSLDNSFVEQRIKNPSELWNGENLDLSRSSDMDSNSGLEEQVKPDLGNLREEVDWSSEIIDSIRSVEEANIYKEANLTEGNVDGRPCLQNPAIDWDMKYRYLTRADHEAISRGELPFGFGILDDLFSMTNRERALNGLAPLDENGQAFELHHVGQRMDSPLAELTQEQHHSPGNNSILHDTSAPTQIDRAAFQKEKQDYWKARAEML